MREFNLNNQNKWYINNKTVTEHNVIELMDSLNIQVNNLCQCLPQDRVQDFAKMNKKELLANTQKAVGRQDLIDKYTRLIEIKDKQKNFAKSIEAINTKLEQANIETNRLMGKVENLHEKRRILDEIKAVKCKKAWEHYNKFLKEKDVADKLLKQATDVFNKRKANIQPIENNINKVRAEVGKLQNDLLKIVSSVPASVIVVNKIYPLF